MDFDDDDDEDIEELVRKIPITHSRSAHARLSRQDKIECPSLDQLPEEEDEDADASEADSDEEFYVHQCLLPLRKSKSDHSFAVSRQASLRTREQFQNIYDSFKQYELACPAHEKEEMIHSPETALVELSREIDVVWPSPSNVLDPHEEYARTEKAIASGVYKAMNPELLDLVTRLTERRNSEISECWSAPGNFFELENEECFDDQAFGEQRVASCWSAPDMSADYQREILEEDGEMAESDYNDDSEPADEAEDDDEAEFERRRRRSLPYFRNRLERSCSADDVGTQRMLTMSMTNSLVEEENHELVDEHRFSPDRMVRFDIGGDGYKQHEHPRVVINCATPLPPEFIERNYEDMQRSGDLCESFDTSTFPSEIVRCEIESPSSDEEAQGDFPLDTGGGANNSLDCCVSPSLSSSKSETHLRCMLDAGRPRSPFFDHQHPENADLDVPDEIRSRSESNAQLIITYDNATGTLRQSTSYHCGEEMLSAKNSTRCTSPACRSYAQRFGKSEIIGQCVEEDCSDSDDDFEGNRGSSMHDLQSYPYPESSSSHLLRKSATSTGFQGNAIVPLENGQRRRRRLPKRPDSNDAARLPMSFSCYDQSSAITFDEAERIWMEQSIHQFRREQAAAAAFEEMEKSRSDQHARPQDLFLGHPRAQAVGASPVRLTQKTCGGDRYCDNAGLNLNNERMWNEKKESNLQCSLNGPADLSAPRHVNKPAATSGGLASVASSAVAAAAASRPTKPGKSVVAVAEDGAATSEKCAAISVPVEQSPRCSSTSTSRPILDASYVKMSSVDTSRRMPVRNDACGDGGAYCDFDSPISPPVNILPSPAKGHRRLPPLPIKSSSAALLSNLGRPFHAHHFPMPTPPSIHSTGAAANGTAPRSSSGGGTQLCFGMETSGMFKSTTGLEDSYYEEDGLNGNQQITTIRQTSFFGQDDSSGVSSCCTGSEHLNPTHRVQSTFIPRHDDELILEIGDAVHVERESEDHWCYGTNLRTHQHGIFPSAHVCEIDIVDEICMGALPSNATKMLTDERDTFYLTMLASIEVAHHKGNDVLVQAMNKVLNMYQNKEEVIVPQTVLMEISFRGIHIIDKRKKNFFRVPTFDFFYSLQNISFCGAHPKQLRYFGFITKHPLLPRFACHVFLSNDSTQAIVESIGRAFKRSYDEYMAFAHPTEDIYIE